MGISSTFYSGYSKQEIETNRIPTPFGDAIVSISGQPISFHYTTKQHIFKNGISTQIHRIRIDTLNYQLDDMLDIQVGTIRTFEFFDSDESTVMTEYHDDKFCIALIGYDTDYDFCTDAFYGGDVYSYDSSCTGSGICCTIVRNPAVFSRKHNRMLYAWVVFLPVSDRYDAADMIDIELL